jgi:hypothetical protein
MIEFADNYKFVLFVKQSFLYVVGVHSRCFIQLPPIVLTHLSIKTSISKPQQEGTKDSYVYTVCEGGCVERRDIYNLSPVTELISPVVTA